MGNVFAISERIPNIDSFNLKQYLGPQRYRKNVILQKLQSFCDTPGGPKNIDKWITNPYSHNRVSPIFSKTEACLCLEIGKWHLP